MKEILGWFLLLVSARMLWLTLSDISRDWHKWRWRRRWRRYTL